MRRSASVSRTSTNCFCHWFLSKSIGSILISQNVSRSSTQDSHVREYRSSLRYSPRFEWLENRTTGAGVLQINARSESCEAGSMSVSFLVVRGLTQMLTGPERRERDFAAVVVNGPRRHW